MLRQIERLTRQTIEIAPVPTAADLRAARLARTRDALRARLLGEVDDALDGAQLDAVRQMIVELAVDFDPVDIAAVAVGLAQEVAGAPDDADDIPVVTARPAGRERDSSPRSRGGAAGTRPPKAGATRLFVNAGRASGVRPQDIVGALANESGLTGRDIGAIQIHERHSLVEIPEHAADDVLRSLRGATTLKGRKANIRRDRGFAPSGGPRRGGRHD
jgi:ATP-dependent RNA helicase DeaD